jgi:hypothetical protein
MLLCGQFVNMKGFALGPKVWLAINLVCEHQPDDHVPDTIVNFTNRGARQPCSSSDVYPPVDHAIPDSVVILAIAIQPRYEDRDVAPAALPE